MDGLTEYPIRKTNRLPGYDYTLTGAYFVTICVSPRKNVFWDAGEYARLQRTPLPEIVFETDFIHPENVPLSPAGTILETAIRSISEHYDGVEIEHYCIMPDHVHLIVLFQGDIFGQTGCPALSSVVGSLKRWVSKQLGRGIWQKSFYEHIIRSEKEHDKILAYIERNPLHWQTDHGDDAAWE